MVNRRLLAESLQLRLESPILRSAVEAIGPDEHEALNKLELLQLGFRDESAGELPSGQAARREMYQISVSVERWRRLRLSNHQSGEIQVFAKHLRWLNLIHAS
jgi:hypothetical protein